MSAYVMQEMTWPEIRDALEEAKLAILPVGSQEQHGVVVNGYGGNQQRPRCRVGEDAA